jgi:hypothetical protein
VVGEAATDPVELNENPGEDSANEAVSPPHPNRAADPRARIPSDVGAIILVWFVGASFFFRAQWSSGFRRLMGDSHDTVHITFLQEHWFQVFHGHVSWRSPAFFYPLKGVLGWSEAFALFQIFYTPLRLLGCDMFLAADLTVILFSLVGFASFVCLARVAFGAQRWIALIGGLAFTFANNFWLHLYWFQLLVVWMVPGVLLLGVLAFRALPEHPVRARALGVAFGLLAALTFFTSFYVAWFSAIAASVAFVMVLLGGRRRVVTSILTQLRTSWRLVLTMAVAFAVGLVPFLLAYIPAQKQVHHLSYATVMGYAARPHDLLNVGTDNVFWSSVVHRMIPSLNPNFSALTYSVTPLVMVLAVVGSALAVWVSRKEVDRARAVAAWSAAALAATAVVVSILPVKTRFGSLWAVVWHIPGATAIRRTNRIGVVAGLLASLALVCAASELYRRGGRRPYRSIRRATIVVLLLLAVAEQVNTTPMAGLDRPAELAFLHSAEAPPRACRSFYVLDKAHASLPPDGAAGHAVAVTEQLDAMLISQKYLIPTINGYTSYPPDGWGLMNPYSPGYLRAVRSWAKGHNVQEGLCELDLGTMHWQTDPAPAE